MKARRYIALKAAPSLTVMEHIVRSGRRIMKLTARAGIDRRPKNIKLPVQRVRRGRLVAASAPVILSAVLSAKSPAILAAVLSAITAAVLHVDLTEDRLHRADDSHNRQQGNQSPHLTSCK